MTSAKEIFEPENIDEIPPLGVGAGWIKCQNEQEATELIRQFARSPVYYVVIGSVTVEEREGNPDPTYIYDEDNKAAYNALGLPGPGIEAVIEMLPRLRSELDENTPDGDFRKLMGISISPATMEAGEMSSIEQIDLMLSLLRDDQYIDFIEINTSCPNDVNTIGEHKPIGGYDPNFIRELVYLLDTKYAHLDKAIGLKLPPYIAKEHINDLGEIASEILKSTSVDYIATANTIPGNIHGDEEANAQLHVRSGGKSGPATKHIGRQQLNLWLEQMESVGNRKYIISMLGVNSGDEIIERIRMGAQFTAVVTAVLQGKNIGEVTTDLIDRYLNILIKEVGSQ